MAKVVAKLVCFTAGFLEIARKPVDSRLIHGVKGKPCFIPPLTLSVLANYRASRREPSILELRCLHSWQRFPTVRLIHAMSSQPSLSIHKNWISQLSPSDEDAINQAADVLIESFPYEATHSWARALQLQQDGLGIFLRQCVPSCVKELGGLVIRSSTLGKVEGVLLLEDLNKPEPAAAKDSDAPPPTQAQV